LISTGFTLSLLDAQDCAQAQDIVEHPLRGARRSYRRVAYALQLGDCHIHFFNVHWTAPFCRWTGRLDYTSEPALYLMGYFEVLFAGKPNILGGQEARSLFANNFHVRHQEVFERQRAELVLIKGSESSRLLKKAVCIGVMGRNRIGQPLKVLSPEMQKIFGTFNGKLSFQPSPTRWVDPACVTRAAEFMRSLP
jgi:hypothetical protein